MTDFSDRQADVRIYLLIGVFAMIGFTLRIAAAQGGLWLDEAWSAVFAHEARGPLDVFFAIRHDNNHYLNTLWLHFTGWGAPPPISRLFSVATGTLTVIVGGMIGLRRGRLQGLLLALSFAISPILVTYGSEARGYAPMFLALALSVLIAARWLDRQDKPPPSLPLALLTAFGMLAHMTMLFTVVAISLWAAIVLASGRSKHDCIAAILKLMGPSLLIAAAILGLGVLLPLLSPRGYQVGGYTPFSMDQLWSSIRDCFEYSLGLRGIVAYAIMLPIVALLSLLIRERRRNPSHLMLCATTLLSVPVLFLVSGMGNTGFARYFLLTSFAILLITSDVIALGWAEKGWQRIVAAIATVAFTAGCVMLDLAVIKDRRGDPAGAISEMARRDGGHPSVILGHGRDKAVLSTAAASAGYRIDTSEDACSSDARFLFLEEPNLPALPARAVRCGIVYEPIAEGDATELSGMSWRLYERR